MSRTLNLAEHLLAQGRKFQALGLQHRALRNLKRLAGLGDLSATVAMETQERLGVLQLQRCRHAKARGHLAAALTHQPDNPRFHYLLADAVDGDAKGDPAEALVHYRRAAELHPDHAGYLSAYGLLAVEQGEQEAGLAALRRARELAPDDVAVLERVVEGFRQADLADEARNTLRLAMFRNPRDSRFRGLWQDFQFQETWTAQQNVAQSHERPENQEPAVLPFRRVIKKKATVRCDAASRTQAPHLKSRSPGKRRHKA